MSRLRPISVRLTRAALVALALACAGAVPALAHGEGEIEWSQFQGGPGHAGVLAEGPEPPYRELWRFVVPEGSVSGAVIVGDLAIATGAEAVHGLDLATGEQAWELPRDGGPISMPAVGVAGEEQVLVYLDGPPEAEGSEDASPAPSPTTDGGGSETAVTEAVGVDLATQEEVWRTPLEAVARSGVTIDGDHAFVADDDGTVYALDLAGGDVAWSAETVGRVESPPAVADGNVYAVARDEDGRRAQVVALDAATGELAWEFSPPGGAVAASAASAADATVVFGAADRLVRGLAAEDGSVAWESLTLTLFSPVSGPSFQPGNVYVADASGGVYRIDPADGGRDWEHQLNDLVVRSSPVVSGSFLLVGVNDGRLVALDPATGDLIWEGPRSPGLVGVIALSHEVVVTVKGGSDAGLIAYEHDPEGALVRVPSPTVVDAGRLYGNFAIAFAIASVIAYVPFRLLRSRMGPAFVEPEDEDETVEDDLAEDEDQT